MKSPAASSMLFLKRSLVNHRKGRQSTFYILIYVCVVEDGGSKSQSVGLISSFSTILAGSATTVKHGR